MIRMMTMIETEMIDRSRVMIILVSPVSFFLERLLANGFRYEEARRWHDKTKLILFTLMINCHWTKVDRKCTDQTRFFLPVRFVEQSLLLMSLTKIPISRLNNKTQSKRKRGNDLWFSVSKSSRKVLTERKKSSSWSNSTQLHNERLH